MKKDKNMSVGNVKPDISRNLPASDPLADVIYDPYIVDFLDPNSIGAGSDLVTEVEEEILPTGPTGPDGGPQLPDFPCLDTAEVIGHEVTGSFRGFVYRPEVTLLIREVEGATDYAVRIIKVP
jgi:hypothetical protein